MDLFTSNLKRQLMQFFSINVENNVPRPIEFPQAIIFLHHQAIKNIGLRTVQKQPDPGACFSFPGNEFVSSMFALFTLWICPVGFQQMFAICRPFSGHKQAAKNLIAF